MLSRSSGAPDTLSEILQDIRLGDASYARCELTKPWGIEFGPQAAARFHFLVEGECWLRRGKDQPKHLHAGDVVLIPHGTGHSLSHSPSGRTRRLEKIPLKQIGDEIYELREGGGGARTLLVCCSVNFEAPTVHPLLELMPPVLLLAGGAAHDPLLRGLLDIMAVEVQTKRLGAATVMTRLADAVIAFVVRAWVESSRAETTGWLAAIRDPKIGRALAAIHRRPGHKWSVEDLASVARSSRSMFSERFRAVVGLPPAQYLARWRMHLASVWLRSERATVAQVAARLGYDSDASFSRAFKRFLGKPPSAFRHS
jgi:AraC-like DNA-binding protein